MSHSWIEPKSKTNLCACTTSMLWIVVIADGAALYRGDSEKIVSFWKYKMIICLNSKISYVRMNKCHDSGHIHPRYVLFRIEFESGFQAWNSGFASESIESFFGCLESVHCRLMCILFTSHRSIRPHQIRSLSVVEVIKRETVSKYNIVPCDEVFAAINSILNITVPFSWEI